MSNTVDLRVAFEADTPGEPGGTLGFVPVEPLGDDRYRIWFHDPLGLVEFGSIVQAIRESDDRIRYVKTLEPTQWKTHVTVVPRAVAESNGLVRLLTQWEQRGFHAELIMGGLLFISVPPNCKFDPSPELDALCMSAGSP